MYLLIGSCHQTKSIDFHLRDYSWKIFCQLKKNILTKNDIHFSDLRSSVQRRSILFLAVLYLCTIEDTLYMNQRFLLYIIIINSKKSTRYFDVVDVSNELSYIKKCFNILFKNCINRVTYMQID